MKLANLSVHSARAATLVGGLLAVFAPRAAHAAERRFGDVGSVDADCRRYGEERDRKARRAEYSVELKHDIRFGVRQLLKARGGSKPQ